MNIPPAPPPPPDPGAGRRRNNWRRDNSASAAPDAQANASQGTRPPRRRTKRTAPRDHVDNPTPPAAANVQRQHQPRSLKPLANGDPKPPRRGARFNAGLTNTASESASSRPPKGKYQLPDGSADDLTSTIIRSLSVAPYADCPICFASIHPGQPTWSCSPLIPVIDDQPQYCWTTFHLKCIRSWSEKSYKEIKDAWRARGEDRRGEWRCPGCQGKRDTLIGGYRCFCGSTPSPNARLATPHSCGNPCSRTRNACPHPCPLSCHPGPCPHCKVMLEVSCPCLRQRVVPVRCGEDTRVSCGDVCDRQLNCGKHQCKRPCHSGPCGHCEDVVSQTCWCGMESRQTSCGDGDRWSGGVGCDGKAGSVDFLGFSCDQSCESSYECGIHKCEKPCHPPASTVSICPLSPPQIPTCPCGKKRIGVDFPPRTTCQDPIPTCNSPCYKQHTSCEHLCQERCHLDDCPPCRETVTRPCRCGNIRQAIVCGKLYVRDDEAGIQIEAPVLCDKPCQALRACGRHRCNRVCCPLASFASAKGKGKKRVVDPAEVGEGPGGLHECDLVCGKMLSCGNHRCEERDHRGPCGRCLRSSFEEMICFCGRTVLEPPVPCGTKIECSYPCVFPPPACGHTKTPHVCHGDDISCPPCPFLTTKLCACGAKMVGNVRCSLDRDKIGCGTVCGKLLECGFHHCERVCHSDGCGSCAMPCGKARKMCLPAIHPCADPCHAPSACSEREPCQSIVTLACQCGRIKQSVRCGRSVTSSGRNEHIKCTSDCEIAKRNARLADALGISAVKTSGGGHTVYTDELLSFGRGNDKFLVLVEKTFGEFVGSGKKTQVLPHMPMDRRKFVIELAGVYRMDTQMVDQEPHRSVQLIRRIDTRVPAPLLSSQILSGNVRGRPNLGKLGNLRSGVAVGAPVSVGSVTKGWGSGQTTPLGNVSVSSESGVTPRIRPTAGAYRPPGARLAEPVPVPAPVVHSEPAPPLDVPDNWEDDV